MLTPRETNQIATSIISTTTYCINGEHHVRLQTVLDVLKAFTDGYVEFVRDGGAYTVKFGGEKP